MVFFSSPTYAELQVTTNFTFLRGASHGEEIVHQAKALGLTAIAVTDRNSLAGVVRAHAAAKQAGLQFIPGARLDFQDTISLLCLPRNRAAYGRLSQLISLGQRRAKKGLCELYLDDVKDHAADNIFIALPPDNWRPEDKISHQFQHDHPPFANQLHRIKLALGGTPVYLAAHHLYRGDDRARLTALNELARDCGIALVATNDVYYHIAERRALQDVLSCIREGCKISEAGFRLNANAERHLKAPGEMAQLFKGHEDAVLRTVEIARACNFSLDELVYEYPDEPVPPDKEPQEHLEELTWRGATWRFPDGLPAKIEKTIKKELALIDELDYAPYFLTVHDIVSFARAQDILCQGRGSAANSAVCYCLGITAVNPIEIDLLFDRFISPERREPPDIDVDFEHERREEVIQYIYARYGRDKAGLAATVISYRARSAVRDVGKAMGLSADTLGALAGMVWGSRSGGTLPEKHIHEAGLDPSDPLLARVLSLTQHLIGFPRHLSQHVGGFVLTRGPLAEAVPIGNAAMEDRTVIEWDKDDLDTLGLLKVDILALGMLSCIHKAFDLLAQNHGLPMTLAKVPREDPAVYDMLCRADSLGVFQVESRAQMNMLPRLKPRCFYDLVIEVAIVRPGPIQGDMVHPYLRRRDGLEREDYPSPAPEHGPPDELRQILGKTKGIPLFQEQAMRIAMVAAKFSGAEANELRKAMATFRRRGTIGELEDKMVSRMVARGYDQDFAARCFNQIKGFGDYGFPESHAASFAHLVYVSSWLKCHYPAVFACALLNSQPMGFYAPAQIVRDAREHDVTVNEVDINHSDWDCTLETDEPRGRSKQQNAHGLQKKTWPENKGSLGTENRAAGKDGAGSGPALRLGMRLIDGLRKEDAEKIEAARRSAPPFTSLHDVKTRTKLSLAALERLAAADAFRSLGQDRRQALWEVRGLSDGEPLPLFQWGDTRETGAEPEVALPQMPLSEHVVNDYQTLRLSLKAHPLSFLRHGLRSRRIISCADLENRQDGQWVSIAGLVLVRQRPGTAKGVVFMTIEDETGIANVVIWSKTLEKYRRQVMGARLIIVHGRVQRHENIIHVVSARLEDKSNFLEQLSEAANERCESARPSPPSRNHPRDARIIPKSRDFH